MYMYACVYVEWNLLYLSPKLGGHLYIAVSFGKSWSCCLHQQRIIQGISMYQLFDKKSCWRLDQMLQSSSGQKWSVR